MEFNAFTGGVDPGGLRNQDEIRILLCYLLSSVNAPLSKADVLSIMQSAGLANYFEVTDALSDLQEKGNLLSLGGDLYAAGEQTRMIAKQLDTALPASVRRQAVSAAINLLASARREQENKVELKQTKRGYHVICHISGGKMDLMSFSLYVPDLHQARLVKQNFQKSPERVYRTMLALVTENKDLTAELIEES